MKISTETTLYGKDKMKNELSTVNSKIEQTAESITSTVNKYTDDQITGVTEAFNSKIEQTSDGINAQISGLAVSGYNFWRSDVSIAGYIVEETGEIVESGSESDRVMEEYIPINYDASRLLWWQLWNNYRFKNDYNYARVAFYNSAKRYISFAEIPRISGEQYQVEAIQVPEGTAFIRLGTVEGTSDGTRITVGLFTKFEYGMNPTPYSTNPQSAQALLNMKISKGDNDEIVSMINASAEVIKITSNRFSLTSDNATISTNGKVKFTSGEIGGWTIKPGYLAAETEVLEGTRRVVLTPSGLVLAVMLINNDRTITSKFHLYDDGSIESRANALFGGGLSVSGSLKVKGDFTWYSADVNGEHFKYRSIRNYLNGKDGDELTHTANDEIYRTAFNQTSDRRAKTEIESLDNQKATEFINSLKPVSYRFKHDDTGEIHHGFIAQEVDEIAGKWNVVNKPKDDNFMMSLRYTEIIADLVATVQEQGKRIQQLERRLDK